MEQNKSCITINCGCCGENNGSNESGNSGVGFPGEEYIDITSPYTAERDGYIYATAQSVITNGGGADVMIRSSNGMIARSLTCFNNLGLHAHLPVKAGAVVEISADRAERLVARFYPAV